MKFIDFEKKINERVKELKLDTIEKQTYYDYITDEVAKIVKEILGEEFTANEFITIYVTTHRGNVVIKAYDDTNRITVKVKRVKGEQIYKYGFIQYYYLNKVEVDVVDKQETLESWYKTNRDYDIKQKQEVVDKVDTFITFMQDKQLSLEDFEKYYGIYNRYGSYIRRKLNV